MSAPSRLDVTVLFAAVLVTWSHGLRIDFSKLSPPDRSYVQHQKRATCQGNPCEPSRPFLCRHSPTCIRLTDVCDGKWDCEGGFDEEPAVCYGVSRPPVEALMDFLNRERAWILPELFNGADPELVAHELTLASSVEGLRHSLSLTDENVDNLRKALMSALEGDERPLLDMGMPDESWPEVKFLMDSLLQSGLTV